MLELRPIFSKRGCSKILVVLLKESNYIVCKRGPDCPHIIVSEVLLMKFCLCSYLPHGCKKDVGSAPTSQRCPTFLVLYPYFCF